MQIYGPDGQGSTAGELRSLWGIRTHGRKKVRNYELIVKSQIGEENKLTEDKKASHVKKFKPIVKSQILVCGVFENARKSRIYDEFKVTVITEKTRSMRNPKY